MQIGQSARAVQTSDKQNQTVIGMRASCLHCNPNYLSPPLSLLLPPSRFLLNPSYRVLTESLELKYVALRRLLLMPLQCLVQL